MCNQTHPNADPNADLTAKSLGWHSYGEELPNPSSVPNYQTVFVLTCICKAEKHSKIWTTLHPSRDAALVYAEKERNAHQSRGEANLFSHDIHEAVLDIRKVRFCDAGLSTNESLCPEP